MVTVLGDCETPLTFEEVAPSQNPLSWIGNDAPLFDVSVWLVLLHVLFGMLTPDIVIVQIPPAILMVALALLSFTLVVLVAVNSHCPEPVTVAEPSELVQLLNVGGAAAPDELVVPDTAALPPIGDRLNPFTVLHVTVLPTLSVMTTLVPDFRLVDVTVFCGFHCTAKAEETPTKAVSASAATAERPSSLIVRMSYAPFLRALSHPVSLKR
jgi:hypothetical protein